MSINSRLYTSPLPWFILIFSIVAATLFMARGTSYYPMVSVMAPDEIGVHFLLRGHEDEASCETTLSRLLSSVTVNCPTCAISTQKCISKLSLQQEASLSNTPISLPSAHMADGVITYSAPNSANALAACQETARQGSKQGISCFPANQTRAKFRFAQPNAHYITNLLLIGTGFALLILVLAYYFVKNAQSLGHKAILFSRFKKQFLLLTVDIFSLELAIWSAFVIRLDTLDIPYREALPLFVLAPLIAVPVFIRFGLYRSVIRHLSFHILFINAKAVAVYSLLLALAVYTFHFPDIPRSVVFLQGIIVVLIVGSSRILARYWLRHSEYSRLEDSRRKKIIIYGAGSAGIQLATALSNSREMQPIALLDDDPALHRQCLAGLEVFSPDQLPRIITEHGIKEVLLAIPSAQRSRRNEIIASLEPLPVHIRTLPGLSELAEGKIKTSDLREVEIEDILGRDQVAPDQTLLQSNIRGKSVMITGAGGSIGSELCRQILDQQPRCLILFELNEFALYAIEQDLINRANTNKIQHTQIHPLLGSVTDQVRLERVINKFAVQTIYHAAAYKHVPMVEKNPCEGVINNILGTYHSARAALNQGVETFVLISTDKAVRPTNTMGTTKRFAELTLQALAASYPEKTRYTMVRFGNVLGSSGSVVPLFREQIRQGGPITVTDPRIIRYFMTIPEAAQLVIQAGAMGQDGDVFVLDMGEPVKIADLASRMIHLSGLSIKDANNPEGDIEIVFTGLRPGEKLYEELLIGDNVSQTAHPRIMRANEHMLPMETIEKLINQLTEACETGDSNQVRNLLQEAVAEFKPQCGNEDLCCP